MDGFIPFATVLALCELKRVAPGVELGSGATEEKVLDYSLEVSESELKSNYYVHFGTITFVEGINPFISAPMG